MSLLKNLPVVQHFKFNRMKQKILSIDFDGTIVENAYPNIGELKPDAKYYINKLIEMGYVVTINTCRSGRFEDAARDFLIQNGIKYHYFNENPPELIKMYQSDCRKISADIYIDDRCLMGLPETWEEIFNLVISKTEWKA